LQLQRIALAWMLKRENEGHSPLGGLLADDQGLGKTISMLALILKNRAPVVRKGISKGSRTAGTLVVCPVSVLRQWAQEIRDKATGMADLKVLIYHGKKRTNDQNELATYDVVLTTYTVVGKEVPIPSSNKNSSDSGPIAFMNWFRVVLDEAQTIRNRTTRTAQAAWHLHAKHKWCLTGTPIQNSITDLFSYFRFLQYSPWDTYPRFCSDVKSPVNQRPDKGCQKLQAILRPILLRRTKGTLIDGQPIVDLPPRIVKLKKTQFSIEERTFYDKLETESREQFQVNIKCELDTSLSPLVPTD
jgi:SNF2 family DNA or RNA helicase